MDADQRTDGVDALLKGAARWEPPDGYALRVIAASRADTRKETAVPPSLARIGVVGRIRAQLSALAARREGAAWVMRQYWRLLRGGSRG
jgi:hypothetical protein